MATAASALARTPRPAPVPMWKPYPAQAPIRVLTVDEHPLVREGLGAIINREPGMTQIADAGSGNEALELYRELRPEVITLDLALPDMPGEELIRLIFREFPDARVVVITGARGDV